MNFLEVWNNFAQSYPLIYDCIVIVLALGVCVIADFVVKKILLRGLKQIFTHLSDSDAAGQSLVLKIAARLANVVPVVILYYIPTFFPDVNLYVQVFVQRLSFILLVVFLTKSLMLMLDLVNIFYQKRQCQ